SNELYSILSDGIAVTCRAEQGHTLETKLKLGQIIPISREYIRKSLLLMEDIASVCGILVCDRIYKNIPKRGKLRNSWNYFWSRKSGNQN
ncbi:MAG TPA: hypothetical protein VLM43_02595, partial [Desulfobacterales bacterium]|nr:hypothetical protein [Desulfobacterales bacterium]